MLLALAFAPVSCDREKAEYGDGQQPVGTVTGTLSLAAMTVVLSTETETHDAVVRPDAAAATGRLRPPANGRPCGSRDHLYMYRYGCGGRRRRAVPLRPTPRDAHPARRSLYADGRVGRTESRGMGRPRLRRPSGGADRPERDRRSGRGALHAVRRRRRAGLRPRIRYAVDRHGRLRRRSARLHDLREPHGLVRSRNGADADPDRRRNRGRGNARVVHATLHGRTGRTTLPLHRQGRIALGARHRMGRPRHLPALRSQRRSSSPPRPASAPSPWRSSPKRC